MKSSAALFCGLASCLLLPALSKAQTPQLKVDLNIADRREAEVNELGFIPWPVQSEGANKLSLRGITFAFSQKGAGSRLSGTYYKTAVQAPNYAKLAGDGLVLEGSAGGALELRISGLPAGKHTLLTYHNSLRGATNKPGPLSISVDGKRQVSALVPSQRVLGNSDCQTAYLQVTAQKGKDVVVLFENAPGAAATGIVINGFELNTSNIKEAARLPFPRNGEEHADADNRSLVLQWKAAPQAVAHEVYVGTDSATVAAATTASPAFKGRTKATEQTVNDLYGMNTYFWRVDEIGADGKATKGRVWYFRPRQLAFAGAEGYGRYARGGRGGKVVHVTNLNDSGPGSLREAVTNDIGPRTIVFDVSGIIRLQERLTLSQKYITLAGQTAPGKGICIAGAPLGIVGDDNVVRFMRVRLGAGRTYDGMGLTGADNSIVDHCSISWTIDEGFSSRGAHNITLQRTIISEALNIAGHSKYGEGKAHGFAGSIGGEVGSFHHNLLAHCSGRNWSLAGGVNGDGDYLGKMDIRNNVVYNWANRATDGGAREVNFVGNYYKPGASTQFFYALNAQHEGYGGGMQRYFFDGNVMPGHFDERNQAEGRKESGKASYQTFVSQPFFEPFVTTQSATDAYKDVLSDVGCTVPVFDDHDIRIIRETLDSTYTYRGSKSGKAGLPDTQEDVGGWEKYPEERRTGSFDTDQDGLPDWWEQLHGSNPRSAKGDFSDANADSDQDGITRLDQYLEWMAAPRFTAEGGKPVAIDLKKLSRGYRDNCTYSVSNAVNGAAALGENGIVSFTPSKSGLASFRFTVKDATGSTFTRQVNMATAVF
ncbi:Ig-like domain-containing protein [Paraflavisolibacter sp. H34]|uniref:Ig-like domain-containing protein n=1 Tax=Huijunlia imazamoxiresistens TaxID=3127457 RepID=UPI00301AAC17